MNVEQKELFLVPFPFSDLSGQKIRPVLILSKNEFNQNSEDVIVCAITTNLTKEHYSIRLNPKDLEEGTLHKTSMIKVQTIFKIQKNLLLKKIGKLKKEPFTKVLEKFQTIFN